MFEYISVENFIYNLIFPQIYFGYSEYYTLELSKFIKCLPVVYKILSVLTNNNPVES